MKSIQLYKFDAKIRSLGYVNKKPRSDCAVREQVYGQSNISNYKTHINM